MIPAKRILVSHSLRYASSRRTAEAIYLAINDPRRVIASTASADVASLRSPRRASVLRKVRDTP